MNVLLLDDEPLSRQELAYLLKDNPHVDEIFQADHIDQALQLLMKNEIQLLFLDIQLNDENGFSLAEELHGLAHPPLVIFATAYDQYAVDAFDIDALDYLLKPFEQERVDQAVMKAQRALTVSTEEQDYPDVLTITQDEKTTVLKTEQLSAAVVENKILTLYTTQGVFQTHDTLSHLKQKLDPEQFIQVHRSVIVRFDQIREIEPWFNHTYQLTLQSGQKVPVGRAFVKPLRQRLNMI